MNDFRGVLDLQVQSLLDALRMQREVRCREIESAAGRRCRQLLADSRRKLRARLHEAVAEERRRRDAELLQALHRLETEAKRRVQRQYRDLLHDAWPELVGELQRRWSTAAERRAWCEMAIDEARDRLAAERWQLQIPASWRDADTRWLRRAFRARGLPVPALQTDAAIGAGLRIRLGSAVLDATLEGLLARRAAVESRLLAAWERVQGIAHGDAQSPALRSDYG